MVKKLVIVAIAISILLLGLGCPLDNSDTLAIDSDKTVTAYFITPYTLTIDSVGRGTTNPSEGIHTYDNDSEVTLAATPATGWRFDHWQGDISGTDDSATLTIDSDKTVSAYFIQQYTLTIGTVGQGTINPSPGSYTYDEDMQVQITANPSSCVWGFNRWGGNASGSDPSITITMDSDKDITAFFNEVEIDVRIKHIFYEGLVFGTEADEFVEIMNYGTEPVNLEGWLLKDISVGYPEFTFPYFILNPGQRIRVHTNQIHAYWGGFSFGFASPIWNNEEPDIAALYNCLGEEVSRKSY